MATPVSPPEETEPNRSELTQFLIGLSQGRAEGATALMPVVYRELNAIARGYLKGERASGKTLQPTALVHEVFLKLFDQDRLEIKDRRHFYTLAARSMRQLLVDHARERKQLKRGGGWKQVSLGDLVNLPGAEEVGLLDLEEALGELAELDARQAQVVELRFFAGLSVRETAEVLGVSKATADREWASARAWLGLRLTEPEG